MGFWVNVPARSGYRRVWVEETSRSIPHSSRNAASVTHHHHHHHYHSPSDEGGGLLAFFGAIIDLFRKEQVVLNDPDAACEASLNDEQVAKLAELGRPVELRYIDKEYRLAIRMSDGSKYVWIENHWEQVSIE
jgi:hypothetical protein